MSSILITGNIAATTAVFAVAGVAATAKKCVSCAHACDYVDIRDAQGKRKFCPALLRA
jgi:ribosomal protein S26